MPLGENTWKSVRSRLDKCLVWLRATYEGLPTHTHLPEKTILQRQRLAHFSYCVIFSLCLAWIVGKSHQPHLPKVLPRVGEISENQILSPLTVEIEPKEPDAEEKEGLARRVPPIYDYDDTALEIWVQKWRQALRAVRQEFYVNKKSISLDAVARKIAELTGQNIPADSLLFFHQRSFGAQTEQVFVKITDFLKNRFIASSDLFSAHYSTGIVIRQLNQGSDEFLMRDISRIWSLDQVREVLEHVPGMLKETSPLISRPITLMIGKLLPPNTVYNEPLTQKRIQAILERTKQPLISLREGQVIIGAKERITDDHIELLKQLKSLTSVSGNLKRVGVTFLILFIFLSMLFQLRFRAYGFWNIPLKEALLFLGINVLTVAFIKLGFMLLQRQFSQYAEGYGLEYLIPISTGSIILNLIIGKHAAYIYSMIASTVVGYMLDQHFFFTVWSFSVCVASIESIQSCKQRTDLFRSGAFAGGIGAVLVALYSILNVMGFRSPDWVAIAITVTLAFLSGIFSIIITSTLIPFLESALGYTTNLKLLELSNFNHPLLHNLMMKAPGTYHHSVIVGSLAELASDRVGANPLLARVSAYYHDIGKMTKPLYFIENQNPNHNPHDHLQPSISAKILFSHVKNGVRLGREHHLGKEIVDIIEQHHGTTLTTYFYNRAKKQESEDTGAINENDFRYPGPKPQTREAGIVMIADACEAATRSISDPTPAKIQAMVHSIIEKRWLDSQFSSCELTQKDLATIEETFTRTLVSLYHHRVEYPGQKNMIQTPDDAKNHHQNTSKKHQA